MFDRLPVGVHLVDVDAGTVLAQADELEAQRILLGVRFLATDSEHFFGVRSYRRSARRGHLLGQLDHSPGGGGRVETTVLHAVESGCERCEGLSI
jgi:hypothetical protein